MMNASLIVGAENDRKTKIGHKQVTCGNGASTSSGFSTPLTAAYSRHLPRALSSSQAHDSIRSLLFQSVQENDIKRVNRMLQLPTIDIDMIDAAGDSLLLTAVIMNHVDMIQLLIDKRADVNYRNTCTQLFPLIAISVKQYRDHEDNYRKSMQSLHKGVRRNPSLRVFFATGGNEERLSKASSIHTMLVNAGASYGHADKQGVTHLMHLIQSEGGQEQFLEQIIPLISIEHLCLRNQDGHTAYDIAMKQGYRSLASIITRAIGGLGSQKKKKKKKKNVQRIFAGTPDDTPLFQAVLQRDLTLAETILKDSRSDINKPDKYGTTPLMWACRERNMPMIRLLLEHGADPAAELNFSGIMCPVNSIGFNDVLRHCGFEEERLRQISESSPEFMPALLSRWGTNKKFKSYIADKDRIQQERILIKLLKDKDYEIRRAAKNRQVQSADEE